MAYSSEDPRVLEVASNSFEKRSWLTIHPSLQPSAGAEFKR